MQALSLIPEKLRQRRRLRQRVLDTVSPRTAFANPKYGSTSRNFIFRVMASRKIAPSPMPGAAVVAKVNVDETSEEETWPQIHAGDGDLEFYSDKPETPCQKIYQRACARLQVLPSMSVYHHLPRSHMTLPHCGVGQDEVKALAIALVHNSSVHTLNMSDNRLGSTGAAFITDALRENRSLTDLNLSHNAIATEGVRLVTETLLSNTSIVRVNLAGNNIQDKDAVHFFQMLKKNKTLRELNLSHNHLCLEGGTLLGEALSVNSTLRILDLSWNHLRLEGAVSVCRGLATNDGLTRLFLAWNGLAMEGCNELGKALCRNTSLVELDVSANRISGAACRRLLAGLQSNATLRCLRIGTNPITTEGALSILLMLADDVTGLTELDLTDVAVDNNFLAVLRGVQEKRPLVVTYGVPLRHDDLRRGARPMVLDTDDPVTILFEFMRQKNLRLIDFLHCLDRDNSDTLTRDELRNGLLNVDIPLSSRSMDILMKKLDINGDGHVDYEELAIGLKDYLRKAAKWKKKAETSEPVFNRLEQLREAIRLRIEASQRRGST